MENPEGKYQCPRCNEYDTEEMSYPDRVSIYRKASRYYGRGPVWFIWDPQAGRTVSGQTLARWEDRRECQVCGRVFSVRGKWVPEGLGPESWLCVSDHTDEIRQEGWIRLELSYGGPQDYFDIRLSDGEIEGATYHFLHWFDGATWELGGDYLRILREYAEATGLVY